MLDRGAPLQHQYMYRLHRRVRVGAAELELSRDQGARLLSPGYSLVTHQDWTRRFSSTILPVGANFWYNFSDRHWSLGNISATPNQPPTTSFASWTTTDESSSSSLLLGKLRLLERSATRGAFQLVKGRTLQHRMLAQRRRVPCSRTCRPRRDLLTMLVLVVGFGCSRICFFE